MTDWLFNETLVQWSLAVVAVATPPIAVFLRWLGRRSPHSFPPRTLLSIALAGPALGAAWLVYNGVIALFDLDSLAGLAVNAAFFALAGIGMGLLWRRGVSTRSS